MSFRVRTRLGAWFWSLVLHSTTIPGDIVEVRW